MSEHTPTPWIVVPPARAETPWVIGMADETSIATCEPLGPWISEAEASANAAFIVKAVNAHDALVAALRSCVDSLNFVAKEIIKSETGAFEAWSHPANSIRMAHAALALVSPSN